MANERSQSSYRGILVSDPRITKDSIWSAQSTYNQATPRTGSPEPQRDTDLVLEGAGDQSAAKELRILAQRGGFPGPDGATFAWRNQGDALYRGYNFPRSASNWESIVWANNTGATKKGETPNAITLQSGVVLCAHQRVIDDGGDVQAIYVSARNASTGAWVPVQVMKIGSVSTFGLQPTILQLPSGRVLLFHYVTLTGTMQIRMRYSDDDGATWAIGSGECLQTAIDISGSPGSGNTGYDCYTMDAAYLNGQILLVVELELHDTAGGTTKQQVLLQLASSDLGCTFSQVELPTGYGGHKPTIVTAGGVFHVFSLKHKTGTTAQIGYRQIANAYQSLSNAGEHAEIADYWATATDTGDKVTEGSIAATVDDVGGLHVYGVKFSGSYATRQACSADNGDSWAEFESWDRGQGDASTYPDDFAATFQRGRVLLFHSWETDVSAFENSLAVVYLGGYSDVELPRPAEDVTTTSQIGMDGFYPFELPENVGWTATGSGTGALLSSALSVTGTLARYYSKTYTATIAQGSLSLVQASVAASGSGGDYAAYSVRLDDGANGYQATVRLYTDHLELWDQNAGSQISGDMTIGVTAGVQLLLAMANNDVRLWYRANSTSEDTQWIAGPTSSSLTDNSTGSNSRIFGNKVFAVGGATVTSNWAMVRTAAGTAVGAGLAAGQVNPDDLFGRAFGPRAVYVDGGATISAIDGPAFAGDSWNIDTRYEYPIADILPAVAPSPITGWRSTDEAQQTVAFQLDAAAETIALNDVIALHLEGINWRRGKLQGYDIGTTSWVDIVTLDAATGQTGLTFARAGNIAYPSGGTSAGTWYYMANELNGATVELVGGTTVRRKISANNEGVWRDTTTKQLKIKLDSTAGGDPATGTAHIWSPRLTAIVQMKGVTYQGYRIKIDAQTGADGYFTIGSAVLGPVFVFGRDYSWGRVRSIEPNVEVTTALDGSRRSRKLGNARRAVDFGWTEGVDLTNLSGTTPDPRYALGTTSGGAQPIAAAEEGPLLMYGLADMLDGPHTPCVYLPRIPKGTPDTFQYVTRGYALYGRLAGGVRLETVQGEELSDEVTRVATVTIEEEV